MLRYTYAGKWLSSYIDKVILAKSTANVVNTSIILRSSKNKLYGRKGD